MKSFLIALFIIILSPIVFAHGAEYVILSNKTLEIQTRFDTGEPFRDSEVLVFPPESSQWEYTLMTDEEGIFFFSPDRPGTWILQVRGEEGHGLRINLPINDDMVVSEEVNGSLNLVQKVIMSLCVIWGAVGTALYFRKKG